jgi:hypothetical protein
LDWCVHVNEAAMRRIPNTRRRARQ